MLCYFRCCLHVLLFPFPDSEFDRFLTRVVCNLLDFWHDWTFPLNGDCRKWSSAELLEFWRASPCANHFVKPITYCLNKVKRFLITNIILCSSFTLSSGWNTFWSCRHWPIINWGMRNEVVDYSESLYPRRYPDCNRDRVIIRVPGGSQLFSPPLVYKGLQIRHGGPSD